MSFDFGSIINKENLNNYLKELAKLYRKQNGKKAKAELVLVGGAAVLVGYAFRNMTMDVDALILASSSMKDAINQVGDRFSLPVNWLNADFTSTASYTPKLHEFSVFYKTFYGVLDVRTVAREYLIAMKLMSGRRYKHDLSDIIGILMEQRQKGEPITYAMIDHAVRNLYGGWEGIADDLQLFAKQAVSQEQLEGMWEEVQKQEHLARDAQVQKTKPLDTMPVAADKESILEMLQQKRREESR